VKKLLLLCIALLIARCTQQIAGTTNETSTGTKAMVAGILFEPDGKTPAKSASVSMRRKTSLADTGQSSKTQPFSTASVTTDRNGKFSIDTIDTGLYIIEGNDGSNNVVLIDSIKVKSPDSSQNLGADTLLPAGVIKGVIKLIEGGDPRKVFVLAFGLDRFALPDANGNFTFPTLAKGNYSLRFLPSLENYGVLDTTGVPVRSGDTMNLDTIVLPFKGIPSPKNLVVSYDTLKQTVFLSWGKTDSSLITGYNIYRSDNKQNFSRISQTPVPKTITFYYDSTIVVGSLYEYRLVSLNTSGNESPMGGTPGDTVRIIPSSQVITTFNWTVKNATAGMASINDTVKFRLNFQNPTRNISRVDWFLNRKDSVIRQSLESSLAGSDSMVFSWNKVGKNTVYVNVIDAGGTVWTDSQSISIIQDVPSVQIIGNDTTFATFKPIIYVIAGNPFSLHGRATQLFGFFVKWEWKIGSGDWKTTNGMDTTLIAPSSEQAMPCSLAVTDDDGNRGICGIQVNMTLGVTKISSGAGFSLILKSDSSLWACGENNSGQLGVGDTVNRNVPVKVMSGVENMSAGGSHSLILKTDGSLWACGANKSGQLGDGTLTNRLLPVQIMSGGVQSMVASRGMLTQYSFILKTDGSLWACGNDQYGQLGDGGTGYYSVPVSIMPNVKSMDAGGFYGQTFIIKMDYTLWACGFNYGALGNVSYTNGSLPIQIMSSVQNVSTGEYNHSLFLKTDNTLWACGENEAGQFGDGTTTGSSVPVQAMNNVIGMSAGGGVPGFSLFLKADSTLWTSGNNASGVLGDGTKITPISPEKIMTNVKSMAAGYAHSLVLKTDGTLWGFGYNDYGALGDGTNTDRLIPIRIIPPQ
jgi:alpha-tubulin suppressor-like RCC1 family protein